MSSMFEDDAKDSDPIDVDDGWGTADDGGGIGDVDEDGWGDAAEGDEGDWGTASVDTEMIPSTSVSSPILTRQSSYLVLNHESLSEKQEALIKQTAEVLFVTNEDAGCLLRHYGWKSRKLQQEWFEDQATIRKTVGLTAEEDKKVPPRTSEGLIQCQSAYCDEVPPDQAHALNCGHVFCDDCWSNYLTSQISHGAASVFATCMGMQCNQDHIHKLGCQCKEMVPESLFAKYVKDEALLKKYKQWQLDSFVEGQRHIKWCPKPGCGLAVSYQSGGTKSIQCKCGHYFCYSCLQEAHTPSPCDLVQKWLQREKSDDATEIWLAAKTKECPKCQVRIEKNKACNHMTCIKCGHHFCIAGGTPVNLRSGLAVRIEDVAIGSNVLAYDEIDSIDSKSASGIVGRNVEAVLDRGVKSCVELLLADGRTLTCTPDHRIMTRKGWIEAGQLEIDRTQLAVGVEYPLHTDRAASDPIAASWSLSLPSLGGRLNVRPNGGVEMAMAFTRTLGYSMSTHTLIEQSSLTTKLTMFHINDVEAALDDIELLTSKRPIIHHTHGNSSYSIFLPSDLSLALYTVGVTSRASSVPTRFPSFLLEETCPIELVREFVGALFGGDGVTLHTKDGGNPTGLALLVRTTGAAASMQEHQLRCELIPLIERLGIESQHIQLSLRALDSSITTSLPIDFGTLSPDSLYDLVLTFSTAAILPFARVIGFRYSASKQVRLSIGAAFYRAIECVQKQRTELVQLVERIRANECDFDFNAAVAQAKSSMASTTTMHSDVLNWHPIDENELRSQPVDASITFADVEKSWCGSEMNWSTPTDSMVSSSSPLLPTFFVTLVGRRSVGLRPTYDLSVPSGKGDNFDSFTAGGIVVHNCWLCKEPWDKHGSSSGGYYTCLAYDASVKAGKISNEEKANIENQVLLQKYGYYYNRYKSSWDAIAMTRKLGERLEKSIKNQDFSKYAFVFEAIDKLMMARRVLQWTYALAYYFKSGKTKHLFEYQQDLLSNATEALQDIVDNTADLDKLLDSRKDIINKTSSIDKFRMEMVNQVERGDFEDLLLSQADAQIERWACANCKTDNPQKATHCTKPTCGACKRHGEPDCKSTICKPPQQPPAR